MSMFFTFIKRTSEEIDKCTAGHHRCVGIGINMEARVTYYIAYQHTLVKFG